MWPAAFAFLAAAGFVCAMTAVAGLAAMYRKAMLSRIAIGVAASGAILYLLVLIGSGAVSPARELARGEEKYICELDCHLAYAVTDIDRIGDSFWITLRMRFDAQTISSHRGNFPLTPGARRIVLVDADGREHRPMKTEGLDTRLRPGEFTRVRLGFDLPERARATHLRFEDADPLKRLLVGSETAPLHRRTVFRLS